MAAVQSLIRARQEYHGKSHTNVFAAHDTELLSICNTQDVKIPLNVATTQEGSL